MQNHLQVKCNHYQNSMEFFLEKEKRNSNICICKEPQKPRVAKTVQKKVKQSQRQQTLQSYSNV